MSRATGETSASVDVRALLESLDADPPRVPRTQTFSKLAESLGRDPLGAVLEGGEDYELLFTAPKRQQAAIARCARSLKIPITPLGTLVPGTPSIEIEDARGKRRRWKARGFDHFRISNIEH